MSQPHPDAKIADSDIDAPVSHHGPTHQAGLAKMAVGAIGVVFGDIGTSPLYAMRDTFAGHHRLPLDVLHIYGIVSLMFWSMMQYAGRLRQVRCFACTPAV